METITREQFTERYGQGALGRFQTPKPAEQGGFVAAAKDIPSDIKEIGTGIKNAFTGGVETANTAKEQVTQGEISPLAGTAKTIGGGLKAGAEAIGAGVLGALKLPFSQKTENFMAGKVSDVAEAVVETDPVQALIQKYEGLDAQTKAFIDGALGTGEGFATMLGAGPAVGATKAAISGAGKVAKTGFKSLDEGATHLKGIVTPNAEGIKQAVDLGFSPEDMMQRVARINKTKQAKFQQRSGESVGSYLVSRNVFGTPDQIVDQLYERMKDSKGRVDASLKTVPGDFKAPQVKTALDDLIERDTRVSAEGAASADSSRITQLFTKYNQQGLNLSEVNEVKRLYERNVRVDYLSVGAPSDKLVRATNIDTALRNLVEDKATKSGVSTIKELNKETSLAKQLLDDLGAEYAGSAGNNAIGLTDTIFLAEALGNPVAAVGFGVKKTLGSKAVQSKIAQKLSKTAGSKESLPDVPESDKLTGYLKYLEDQKANQNAQ